MLQKRIAQLHIVEEILFCYIMSHLLIIMNGAFNLKTKKQPYGAINKVSDLIDCEKSFEEVVKCNNLLEISIKAIRDVKTKIISHEADNKITEKELKIGTEQEFRLMQIYKLIDSFCINVENISPFNPTQT